MLSACDIVQRGVNRVQSGDVRCRYISGQAFDERAASKSHLILHFDINKTILISDTRDAYEKAQAIKTLYADVNQRIQRIRSDYEAKAKPLIAELERLRTQKGTQQQRKAQLLLQLADLQKQAGNQQQKVGVANEKALARVDIEIAKIEQTLKTERKASAVLHAQEMLYFRADCTCNITEELYLRLNRALPSVALAIDKSGS